MGDKPTDEEVFKKDGFICVYCGFDGNTFEGWTFLQVDHFIPRSKGGSNNLDNLYTSCASCNLMKNAGVWGDVDSAKKDIGLWRNKMRNYWNNNVQHLVSKKQL